MNESLGPLPDCRFFMLDFHHSCSDFDGAVLKALILPFTVAHTSNIHYFRGHLIFTFYVPQMIPTNERFHSGHDSSTVAI